MSSHTAYHFLSIDRAMDFIGDHAEMLVMLRLFEQALISELPLVRERLLADDVAGAQKLLHPLKGFVPVFCSDEVVDQVATVEALSKESAPATVLVAFDAVQPNLHLVLAEVRHYLLAHP
jgi:hypothetical protein